MTGLDLAIAVQPKMKGNKIVTGKTKVTFTVTKNGKRYPLSCEVTIRKAPNPFKSLKINGKNHTSDFNKYNEVSCNVRKKAKITYRLRGNYKMTYTNQKGKSVKLKSGSTIRTSTIWITPQKVVTKYQWDDASYYTIHLNYV